MERTIKRGDIFYADLNPVVGSEQGGRLPESILPKLNHSLAVSIDLTAMA